MGFFKESGDQLGSEIHGVVDELGEGDYFETIVGDVLNGEAGSGEVGFGEMPDGDGEMALLEVGVGVGEEDFEGEGGIREGEMVEDLGANGVELGIVF